MNFPIYRLADSDLLIVKLLMDNKFEFKMILDTGATNTTIDSSALYLFGYDIKNSIGITEIETGNGIIESEIFEIKTISSLGIVKNNFHVQVYDFLSHGILSDYDGLLGLDFLKGMKFCIDMNADYISINRSEL